MTPVSTLRMETDAPATMAPVLSVTVPVTRDWLCAKEQVAEKARIPANVARRSIPLQKDANSISRITTASDYPVASANPNRLGVRVLRTPVRAPKANSVCERFGENLRRECLDFVIPFGERHLKLTIQEWIVPYHPGRPHSALGAGDAVSGGGPDFRNPPRPTF